MKTTRENIRSLRNNSGFSGKEWREAKRASRLTMKGEIKNDPLLNKPYNRQDMLNRAANLYRLRMGAQDEFDEAAENYTPEVKPITNYSTLKDRTRAFSRKQWQEIRGQIAERDPNMGFNELQRKTGEHFNALLNRPTNVNRPSGFAEIKSPSMSIGAPQLSETKPFIRAKDSNHVGMTVPGTAPLRNESRPEIVAGENDPVNEFFPHRNYGGIGTEPSGNLTYGGPVQQPKERKQPVWSGAATPANWFQEGGVIAEIRPDSRSWVRREIIDPVKTWIKTRPGYETFAQTADFVSDFIPVVGEAKDLSSGNYLAAAIGLVPGIGDVAAKVVKNPVVKKVVKVAPKDLKKMSRPQIYDALDKVTQRFQKSPYDDLSAAYKEAIGTTDYMDFSTPAATLSDYLKYMLGGKL